MSTTEPSISFDADADLPKKAEVIAQRVPVRIRITHVPAGVPLVSGMTATVTIRDAEAQESGSWLRQRSASLADHLADIVHGSHHHRTACRGSPTRRARP